MAAESHSRYRPEVSKTVTSNKPICRWRAALVGLQILLVGSALLPLAGCGGSSQGDGAAENLTPAQFEALPDHRKEEYRQIELRIPEGLAGVQLLPVNRGKFDSVVDRAVHTGMLEALMAQYTRALFESKYPRFKVEFVPFEMWGEDFKAVLAASLASGKAPAAYVARDLPGTAEQGLFADITDLIKGWDQADLQPATAVAWGYIDGRHYVIAGPDLGSMVIMYRKDWFREAGIFNEYGEPGPPTNWTWEDFKRIAKQLTRPKDSVWGYADEPGDLGWSVANGFMYFVPDKAGEHTWRFNDKDPRLLIMLTKVRDMKFRDKSVLTGTGMSWGQWHQEFEGGRAAMIRTFSPYVPTQMLNSPYQFGQDKLYSETVGMVLPPTGSGGLRDLMPDANVFGFNPRLKPEELLAAFEWMKSYLYGETYLYRMRVSLDRARIYGKGDIIYRDLLISPYRAEQELDLPKPLEEVFPPDYIRTYDAIKGAPALPMARGFGLTEPAGQEYLESITAMFSEALADENADLEDIVARTAARINQNVLDFKDENDREKLKNFYTALGDYYRDNFPTFYNTVWPRLLEDYYKVW